MKTLLVVLRKEFTQFFHDSFLPKLCLLFPLLVMLVMPLVTSMEVKHVGVLIVDNDRQKFSRSLAANVNASEYLSFKGYVDTYDDALRLVEAGKGDVILEIPYEFYASLFTSTPKTLNLWANAVNSSKGSLGLQYLQQSVMSELSNELKNVSAYNPAAARMLETAAGNVKITELSLFNPTLNYRHFMIPALMIMLLIMLCGFLPALNIVGEKEVGTIEQINVTPISQITFTLGKVVPYWIIGFVVLTLAIFIAFFAYGLWPKGSLAAIYIASFLFIIVMSSLGMILANSSTTMQQVMFMMFFFVMVFMLMSGLMTPVASMPVWAQNATYAIPPRYFVDIMRATYLRGATLSDQWFSFTILAVMAVVFTIAAVVTYKKQN